MNPLFVPLFRATGIAMSLTADERIVDENCKRLRAFIRTYVDQRIEKKQVSKVSGNSDLLSTFLESPDIFTAEDIVDELIDFIGAGSMTVSMTT